MKIPGVNLGELQSRLGIKTVGGSPFDYTPQVLPVQVMQDVSPLTTPLLPPTCHAGGTIVTALGTQSPIIQVESRAVGGIFITDLRLGALLAQQWRMGIITTPILVAPPATVATTFNCVPTEPGLSRVIFTNAAPLPLAEGFTILTPANVSGVILDGVFYIEPGSSLYIEGVILQNTTCHFGVAWREVPVGKPPS